MLAEPIGMNPAGCLPHRASASREAVWVMGLKMCEGGHSSAVDDLFAGAQFGNLKVGDTRSNEGAHVLHINF